MSYGVWKLASPNVEKGADNSWRISIKTQTILTRIKDYSCIIDVEKGKRLHIENLTMTGASTKILQSKKSGDQLRHYKRKVKRGKGLGKRRAPWHSGRKTSRWNAMR